jgi:hypothetical protein
MWRSSLVFSCSVLALLLLGGAASAEEIVYFTNGTTMPIRSHEIKGEMIHVDLGGESFMAFPMRMVEKVEKAGSKVMLDPSYSGGNRISGGSRPVRGTVPSRYSDSENKLPIERAADDPQVQMDGKSGVAVYRPYGDSRQAGKKALGAAGNQRVMGGAGGYTGTRRKGSRHVIGGADGPKARGGAKPPVTGLERRPGTGGGSNSGNSGNNSSSSSSSSSSSDSGSGN